MMIRIGGKVDDCSFVITEENQKAMEAVLEFAGEEGNQFLCIYGEEGTGKTHLSLVARDVLDEEGLMARVLTEWNWMEAVIRWKDRGRDLGDLHQEYKKWDCLILENIHRYEEEDFQEAFCGLVNHFWLHGKKLLVTCECHPQELVWFEDEALFRKTHLVRPSRELKEEVLKDYEHIAEIELPEKVRNVILDRTSKLPEMRNALCRAILQHKGQGKELTEEWMKSILKKEEKK